MKVYYKQKFWASVGSLVLGTALPLTCLIRQDWSRFDLKDGFLAVCLVLIGVSGILRSIDPATARADYIEDNDERNRYIQLRSRAATCQVLEGTIFLGMLASAVAGAVTGNTALGVVFLTLTALYLVSLVTRIFTEVRYGRRG